jgi:serine/threonine protein kinase
MARSNIIVGAQAIEYAEQCPSPSPPPSPPGHDVSITDFSTLSKLGEGGFGTVLLVKKNTTGTLYALKILKKARMTKPGTSQRVISERQSMLEMQHPFICQLYGAFQDDKHIFFLLEFVAGGDLFALLERSETLSEELCKVYIGEIALAIGHVHAHKYMYRDLKTENVLIGADGHLKLADFGLAKMISTDSDGEKKVRHTLVGTPGHLAPELFFENCCYGASVDWWAVGVVFGEMLLGDAPIVSSGDDMASIMALKGHYEKGTHLQEELVDSCSAEAASLIRALLTINFRERLGCGADGVEGFKRHPMFESIDWEALYRKELGDTMPDVGRLSAFEEGASSPPKQTNEADFLEKNFTSFVMVDETTDEAVMASKVCDAASRGDLNLLRKLIKGGALIDAGDYDRRTAMHLVCSEGFLEVAQFLVHACGANVNVIDRWGGTPLDDAIRHNWPQLVEFLQACGAEKGSQSGGLATDFCGAAAAGDVATLRRIIASGDQNAANQSDYDKRTPLHLAASEGLLEVVTFLIEEAGAHHSPIDRWGGTPLSDALRAGRYARNALLQCNPPTHPHSYLLSSA